MPQADGPRDLEGLLDELDRCAGDNGPRVSVEQIMDAVGRRSFGPLLLLTGLLGMTPVSAIPGAPSTVAVVILLVAGQLLFGRDSFWLPRFLLKLKVPADKLGKTVKVARKPARVVDKLVKPRMTFLAGGVADRLVALVCVILALMTPPLELLPFVAFFPSAAIAFFGLGLVARDGLLVMIGLLIATGALGFAGFHLLR
jgi:hypothetical protein